MKYKAQINVLQVIISVYKQSHRLHRDISVGNIVLLKDPSSDIRKGYLVDWEASCRLDPAGNICEGQPGQTVGTRYPV